MKWPRCPSLLLCMYTVNPREKADFESLKPGFTAAQTHRDMRYCKIEFNRASSRGAPGHEYH